MSEENERGFRVTDRRGRDESRMDEPVKKAEEPKAEPKQKTEPRMPGGDDFPRIDFKTFVLSMSTSAMMHMGVVEDPQTGKKEINLLMARQEIDIIEMLERKTRGNLESDEKKLMDGVLYELRLRFVEAAKSAKK